jgi:magnesium transporter
MKTFLTNGTGLQPTDVWHSNCWINVECPDQSDLEFLQHKLEIPPTFITDIEDIDERPRIETEDGWSLVVIRIPYKTTDDHQPFATVPLGIITKNDITITLCFHKTEMISDFILYTQRKNIQIDNNYDLVLKLLLSTSVWFLKYLKQINQLIKLAEKQLESIKNEELQILLRIEKCLVFFTTSLKGNDILLNKLRKLRTYKDNIDEDLIEEVEIELRQAHETTNIYSDILSGMMDAYASVISNNLNVIMKQLTLISIILMIPTLIASLYGMNMPNYLENNPYGFGIIALSSFILASFGVLLFKRKNWF